MEFRRVLFRSFSKRSTINESTSDVRHFVRLLPDSFSDRVSGSGLCASDCRYRLPMASEPNRDRDSTAFASDSWNHRVFDPLAGAAELQRVVRLLTFCLGQI